MKSYRVYRVVTRVEFVDLQAASEDEALQECEDNAQLQDWRHSSDNDPQIISVEEKRP